MTLINDLSSLTTIPESALNKLQSKVHLIYYDKIIEDIKANKYPYELDISIGKLYIYNDEEVIKYKFIPNLEFETDLLNMINNKWNPLKEILEKTLVNKITHTYKDII